MQEIIIQEINSGDRVHLDEWPGAFLPQKGDQIAVYGPTKKFIGKVESVDSTVFCQEKPFKLRVKIYMIGTSQGYATTRY